MWYEKLVFLDIIYISQVFHFEDKFLVNHKHFEGLHIFYFLVPYMKF